MTLFPVRDVGHVPRTRSEPDPDLTDVLVALVSRVQVLERRNAEMRAERTRQSIEIAELRAAVAALQERVAASST